MCLWIQHSRRLRQGGSWVQNQSELYIEFQPSLGFIVGPCLKSQTEIPQTEKDHFCPTVWCGSHSTHLAKLTLRESGHTLQSGVDVSRCGSILWWEVVNIGLASGSMCLEGRGENKAEGCNVERNSAVLEPWGRPGLQASGPVLLLWLLVPSSLAWEYRCTCHRDGYKWVLIWNHASLQWETLFSGEGVA